MKTEWNKSDCNEKPFPKLMLNNNNNYIVFFAKSGCGQIMWSSSSTEVKIGLYYDSWVMCDFKDIEGHGHIKLFY